MVARMDGHLLLLQFGVRLKGDRLVGIIGHNIPQHVVLGEHLTPFGVPDQPQARRVIIIVVGYGQVIRANLSYCVVVFIA